MSIETEITRISTNVSDTLSAVSEMGGEVPEGATSNDMAAGVRSIPVGAKIDDTTPSTSTTYSSSKIESELTVLNDANAALIEVSKTEPNTENTELWIHPNADEVQLPQIDDSVESVQDTWSSKKIAAEVSNKANEKDLAVVAKSGSYNDLSNKPTIPTVPSALPNPNALTFTGAVNETYDGSAAKSVAIPTVPESLKNPNKLILTGAVSAEYDGSAEVRVDIPAGSGSGYELSVAMPEMYGAVGDGETDDTQALQSAIDSGKNVLLTGRYKVSEVKLSPYVTMTSAPGGRIIDGKVMMCPYSSIVGVVFEVTSGNTNNCIVDIGTYDATGVADNGGDDRYTIRDVKVVTNFAVKSNLDFVYIHVGDGELAHLFGVRITNVSIDGRLGKVFHFKAHLKEGNIVDNGNGVWVNTVSIDNVWCGVPEYIVYTDYADPNGLKAQLGTSLRIGEVYMHNVAGEYSAYAKNDVYIGFPSTISAKGVGFVDKGYTQADGNADTAVYNIDKQPWYNSAKTIIRTDYLDERFFAYAGLANQNIAYINGSYAVDEATLYETFLHDLSNNAYGLMSSRTTDAPAVSKALTLNLVRDDDATSSLMGAGLNDRMVIRGREEDGGSKFALYARARPAVGYDDRVGCLYSDLYMPYAVSKAQLGDAYTPVIGSMVFNSATGLPMWYTGDKWVYADGTESGFEFGEAVSWKSYILPVASAERLGGVKPAAKSDRMTQAVGVDESGGLWTLPGGEGGSSVELDTTLSVTGKAADAGAVGTALNELNGANVKQDTEIAKKANESDLAAVAKSGSYEDLKNKPTIPTVPSALPNPNALTFTGAVTGSYDGSAPMSVEIPSGGGGSSGGSGKAKSQILIDQEITELTASLSVTLEHDFHNLTAIISCGSAGAALTADSGGAAIASRICLLIDTTSFSYNSRKVAQTGTSTEMWKTVMFGAEWSDDLSVFKRGVTAEIANNKNQTYYFEFGGTSAMYGTLGTDDNAPRTGKTANIVVNGAYLNVGTRVVLWGEYYE